MGNISPQTGANLDVLLKTRFHGAVNIRGIRYQLLYSLLCAFELLSADNPSATIRLEGIEDVDLLGLYTKDTYIQIKTSERPWTWSKLKDPVESFLSVSRKDLSCHFVLAVDFSLRDDIARLSCLAQLSPTERHTVNNHFITLCRQLKGTAKEAMSLLNRLEVISLPEPTLWQRLQRSIAEAFDLGSQAIDLYLLVLVARFLEWAVQRRTITYLDLEQVRSDIGEALSREATYQAYGRGLVDRLTWTPDGQSADFFDGKGTRPGHIVDQLDVRRPRWLELIDQALQKMHLCALRSSSGQGKSTLLYRYARDFRPEQSVYLLRIAETQELRCSPLSRPRCAEI